MWTSIPSWKWTSDQEVVNHDRPKRSNTTNSTMKLFGGLWMIDYVQRWRWSNEQSIKHYWNFP